MPNLEPLTRAEATNYRETSLHKHVLEFVESLRARTKKMIVQSMGASGQGQDMPVLVFGATGPEDARAQGKPVILVLANIHAGEVEGKEALLMLARDMTLGPLERFLDKLCLVFVPNYNPDGNDRIAPENRKLDLEHFEGQINPEGGVGTRYTGVGINLNRDYMKMEAVESRHLAKLYNRWWPNLTIDSHTTDGSIHAYALTYDTALGAGARGPIEYVRTKLLPSVTASLQKRTGLRTFFYGNFRKWDEPTSGWETYSPLPRYGSHYRGLTGRMDILLESYSYIPFRERVVVTYEILVDIFDYAIANASEMLRESELPKTVDIQHGPAASVGEIEVMAYDLETLRQKKFTGKLTPYRCEYYGRFPATKTVERPRAYLVRGDQTPAIRKLADHGIRTEPAKGEYPVTAFTVTEVEKTSSPDVGTETRSETVIRVEAKTRTVAAQDGDVLVPADQRLGVVAVYLLEPESEDGLVRWNYFDAALKVGEEFPVYRCTR